MKFNICIIGKGSIGKRHHRILEKNFDCNIFFIRRFPKFLNEIELKISLIKKFNFDFFIICNPTILHYAVIKRLIIFKKPILVEKPLFYPKNIINNKLILKNKKIIFTAYMMRYDKGINYLLKYVRSRKPISADINWLTYMPNWHKNENYKNSYASIQKLGGGVISTCSHEIDLAIYLFGDVISVYSTNLNQGLKNIDVEDKNISILKHKNGVVSKILLDFSSRYIERKIKLYYEKFIIEWDFLSSAIFKITNTNTKKIYTYKQNIDDLYLKELNEFIFSNKKSIRINYENTIQTQNIIKKLFLSARRIY